MPELSWTCVSKLLAAAARWLTPSIFRFKAERSAAKQPFEINPDYLEDILEKTYSRLCSDSLDMSLWKQTSQSFLHQVVCPKILKDKKVQKFLALPDTKNDFINLASSKIVNPLTYDKAIISSLSNSYSAITGKSKYAAIRVIVSVNSTLLAGYRSALGPQNQAVLGALQASVNQSEKSFENLGQKLDELSSSLSTTPNNQTTSYIEKELDSIIKLRSINKSGCEKRIKLLADRIINKDLKTADISAKSNAIYWAARLLAGTNHESDLVSNYLKWLEQNNNTVSTGIIHSLLSESDGDIESAIKILSDADGADERASLFALLKRAKGSAAALDWYRKQPINTGIDFFTGIGWANLAITFATEGKWDEAIDSVKGKEELFNSWPDLAYVAGILHLAVLLPDDYKQESLKLNIFHNFITTNESEQNDVVRLYADECFETAELLFKELLPERAETAAICRILA